MAFDNAKRVMSGTWGEVWLDGDKVAEAYGLQLKVSYNKEDVKMCGQMAVDSKVTSVKMTGSLKMHKLNSRMALKIGQEIRNGKDLRFTIISKLDDPDAYGAERIAAKSVSMDDLTLADWVAGVNLTLEASFSFTDYNFIVTVIAY